MKAVIPLLLAKGHQVIGVDNLLKSRKPTDYGKDYRFIQGDLTDRKVAEYAMEEADSVIQAAARIYGVSGFHVNRADILGEDVSLHNNVLRAAVAKKVDHVTYISSSMVYESIFTFENSKANPGFEEDEGLIKVPRTDYGLSKFVGERLSHAFKEQYDINYTIWRPFNIVSPYEISTGDVGTSHVFADFIKHIVIEKRDTIPLIGDGSQIRCFTWIDEVAQAIADFQYDERVLNQTYNLGNPEPVSMKELAEIIREEAVSLGLIDTKELKFDTIKSFTDDVKVRIPNVSAVSGLWTAKIKTRESIKRCLQNLPKE